MRFLATMRRDALLQHRYGLYAVSLVVVAAFFGVLQLVPDSLVLDSATWAPAFVLGNLMLTTFFFMAGAVLLERDEGTVTATVTTPLRDIEYLGSKVVSFALLALAENVAIVLLFFGMPTDPAALVGGIVLGGAVLALCGFVSVAHRASISEWLMPSMLWITVLLLPLLGHFGLVHRGLLIWHPVQPAMVLLRASYEAPAPAVLAVAWIGGVVWTVAAMTVSLRSFERWIVRGAGAMR